MVEPGIWCCAYPEEQRSVSVSERSGMAFLAHAILHTYCLNRFENKVQCCVVIHSWKRRVGYSVAAVAAGACRGNGQLHPKLCDGCGLSTHFAIGQRQRLFQLLHVIFAPNPKVPSIKRSRVWHIVCRKRSRTGGDGQEGG